VVVRAEPQTESAHDAVLAGALALRDYQQEALAASAASPWRRQLVALPTGVGKTVVFAHQIARVVAAGGRAIVLVHRDELVQQTLDKLAFVRPGLAVGVVKAARNECDGPVVVASVQTVYRPKRLEQLGRDFALVVVDEAHHAPAASYLTLGVVQVLGPHRGLSLEIWPWEVAP
jgi:superfamily II DNA or RNA helicase